MTSFRQIEANRRNSLKSTGPSTEQGKRRSRRNAIRHGLCAETVIEMVEDIEDYRGFEAAIIADYDAQTAVERELVLRLASLLWRLRRATSIETDLLRIQAEILRDRRDQKHRQTQLEGKLRFHVLAITPGRGKESEDDLNDNSPRQAAEPYDLADRNDPVSASRDVATQNSAYQDLAPRDLAPRDLAHCFQRLANLDNGVFERLGRYETALWRQTLQTLLVLQSARRG
jgi:hypothetical protein